MSATVDVLAVMDRLSAGIEYEQRKRISQDDREGAVLLECTRRDSIEARAAVAELIEAVNQAYEFVDEMGAVHGINNAATKSRLRAALARVGGAA